MTIISYLATHTVDRELATADQRCRLDSRYTSARSGRVHQLIRGFRQNNDCDTSPNHGVLIGMMYFVMLYEHDVCNLLVLHCMFQFKMFIFVTIVMLLRCQACYYFDIVSEMLWPSGLHICYVCLHENHANK